MRRLLKALGALLAVTMTVVVARALLVSSLQPAPAKGRLVVPATDVALAARHLAGALRYRTISTQSSGSVDAQPPRRRSA